MTRRTNALQFGRQTALKITERDGCCIFCKANYHMDKLNPFERQIQQIAHYINRSQGGLGIEENGVLICQGHHGWLDNGNRGRREEMLQIMEMYFKNIYPDWHKENLIYKKWR